MSKRQTLVDLGRVAVYTATAFRYVLYALGAAIVAVVAAGALS